MSSLSNIFADLTIRLLNFTIVRQNVKDFFQHLEMKACLFIIAIVEKIFNLLSFRLGVVSD